MNSTESIEQPRLPAWLNSDEQYDPPRDRDAFVRRSAAALSSVLSQIRRAPVSGSAFGLSTPVETFCVFALVLLVAAAQNFAFVEILGAATLVRVALLPPRRLADVLTAPFQAFLFSLLITAPAAFFGQPRAFVVVPCKTLVATTLISLLARSAPWNRLSASFKTFGAPDLFIFVFDLTLKYVALLSEIALQTLDAVRLRSVGRDRRKSATLGGVVGVAFLKAQDAVEEQFDAMTCRGFSGEYRRFPIAAFRPLDALGGVALVALFAALFLYLESFVR
ncbi:MAG: hypothetical protein IKY61_00220 [Thermoguttaceae bacterium]|nr:hypothetical protein [Thermoguttaceae bacterium]